MLWNLMICNTEKYGLIIIFHFNRTLLYIILQCDEGMTQIVSWSVE